MHQNLVDRPGVSRAQRDKARFALAEDYFSAGLFDRAEDLYLQLREAGEYRIAALKRLLRICEVTAEWDRAVDLCGELLRITSDAVPPAQLAANWPRGPTKRLAGSVRLLSRPRRLSREIARHTDSRRPVRTRAWRRRRCPYAEIARAFPSMLGDVLPRLLRTVPGLELSHCP
jgi:hypothetical protein